MKVKRKSFFILGMQQLQSQIQIPLGSLPFQPSDRHIQKPMLLVGIVTMSPEEAQVLPSF
jgi:hypothetical protein